MITSQLFIITFLLCSGYMSPEYAGYGKFSTKSDVFSFGVIVLEIISGKKNNASYEEDHSINLIGHVSKQMCDNNLPFSLYWTTG